MHHTTYDTTTMTSLIIHALSRLHWYRVYFSDPTHYTASLSTPYTYIHNARVSTILHYKGCPRRINIRACISCLDTPIRYATSIWYFDASDDLTWSCGTPFLQLFRFKYSNHVTAVMAEAGNDDNCLTVSYTSRYNQKFESRHKRCIWMKGAPAILW
jgi:hypothetical protein